MNPFDLADRVALVTGSTRGIGRGIAEGLRAAGADVTVSSESAADTAAVAAELGVNGFPCDVANPADNDALAAQVAGRFGRIDILVCNAGITGAAGTWSLDDFDRVMAVNLRSMVSLTGAALPYLSADASVILISSISGLRGNGSINAYALAKAAVAQLARNLAVQWGPRGIRVNAISPGLIRTELSAPLMANAAFMERRMAMTPLRRMGEIDEIAGAVTFLASRAGGFVTGHNLVVDGGTVVTDAS